MKVFELIKSDLKSFHSYPKINSLNKKVTIWHFLKAIFDIDFRAIFLYRIASSLISSGMKKIGILIYYRLKAAHAIDISPYASVGPGLKIVHAFNIVIGPHVSIGKNCVIFNSVTLGNSHPGWKDSKINEKLMPAIGDKVVICPGVRIIGAVNIGNNALIGANSVVIKNIPESETWAGVPARNITKRS